MRNKSVCELQKDDRTRIETAVNKAVELLFKNDGFLLEHDVSERAITHRLALYLTEFFPDYDVDCEYNNDVDARNGRKYIAFLVNEAKKMGLITSEEALDQDFVYRSVFPDIIVHKRGKNGGENNLLVIEVKKSSSKQQQYFDHHKLQKYTSSEEENHLAYSYGIFLEIPVGESWLHNQALRDILWFQNGKNLKKPGLKRVTVALK